MYHVMKFQAPFERLKEYNSSPEIILYKAIITQAIIDATNISDAPRAKTLETDAKKWIFSNSDYFQKICYIAGIEPRSFCLNSCIEFTLDYCYILFYNNRKL